MKNNFPSVFTYLKFIGKFKYLFVFIVALSVVSTTGDNKLMSQVNTPRTGFQVEGEREFNTVTLKGTKYVGDCPGHSGYRRIRARFTSEETSPASGRRVIVRNISNGMAVDPAPYTDREYYEGRLSEATILEGGHKHRNRSLSVFGGENLFEYEIKEKDQVIDSGQFTFTRDLIETVRNRDSVKRTRRVCAAESIALRQCADIRNAHEELCGSRVINSTLDPSWDEIKTRIENNTSNVIDLRINGRFRERLYPGSFLYFTTSGSLLNVEYNSSCKNCNSNKSIQSLQPGGKYYIRRNNSGNLGINL